MQTAPRPPPDFAAPAHAWLRLCCLPRQSIPVSSVSYLSGRLGTAGSMSFSSSSRSSASKKRGRPGRGATAAPPWGASSPSTSSASRSSRKSPFLDFGSYMSEKNRKLHDQFDANASSSSTDGCGIFYGVSIFVDGFTVPSSQELKAYMLKHGGRFENYFSKKRVTHIICSNLPDSKMKNMRSFSRGLPVVKPTWIVDSLEANRLLSWISYQLDELVTESGKQQKLSTYFDLKAASSSENSQSLVSLCGISEKEVALPKEDGCDQIATYGEFQLPKSPSRCEEAFNFTCEGLRKGKITEHHYVKDENSVTQDDKPQLDIQSKKFDTPIDEKIIKESPDKNLPHDYAQHHSTLGDSNFVENYFKNSRLHFIGTWRNRYRRRFLDRADGANSAINIKSPIASRRDTIIHVDMDCFFVSVVIRNYPMYHDKPVAVCHSDNPKGTAEISSANYPARGYGVKAGMFVRDAKSLCPELLIFPYDFEAYEEVADKFYEILHRHCSKVQALSCDEAFLDVSDRDENADDVATIIRQEIAQTTRCTASAGIAGTLLVARLATRSAKPNGQCFIPSEKVDDYLMDLPIKALPGIGHVLQEKLRALNIQNCGQLRSISKEALQNGFGFKVGEMLWNYCRGIDNRDVDVLQYLEKSPSINMYCRYLNAYGISWNKDAHGYGQETKSVGAEVNWGVRFNDMNDCHQFLTNLCKEVSLRLQGCGVRGRTITLKIKKRKDGATEPVKYMGCGDCINLSRSLTIASVTDSMDLLQNISKQLLQSLHVDVKEVRGIGLQISRLEHVSMNKQGQDKNRLESWLSSGSEHTSSLHDKTCHSLNKKDAEGSSKSWSSKLPPVCHLDMDVIRSLPSEIISEMNELYNGGLSDILEVCTERNNKMNNPVSMSVCPEDSRAACSSVSERISIVKLVKSESFCANTLYPHVDCKGKQSLSCAVIPTDNSPIICKVNEGIIMDNMHTVSTICIDKSDLMPGSLSQIDISVLQQLPDELKADIIDNTPANRKMCSKKVLLADSVKENVCNSERVQTEYSKKNLWEGDPPGWVQEFQITGCTMLICFVASYFKCRSKRLSSIFQIFVSLSSDSSHQNEEQLDMVISGLSELLIQYIKLKIDSDIEEIYICFRLLKRFALRSQLFTSVLGFTLPSLEAFVSENYGGKLHLFSSKES